MFTTRWRLFRVGGIPISVDASWLLILALLTFNFHQVYAENLPSRGPTNWWLLGLATAVSFFVCIVLHELGHALVARSWGIPLEGITLFLFGGVAELRGEPTSARSEFFMAVAGPVVSAFLAGLFFLLGWLGKANAWPVSAVAFLEVLAFINFLVLLFNLIPAFPLDGGRVLRSALWGATGNLRRATRWASLLGQGFAWVLIFLGVMSFFQMDYVSGIWSVLIGIFLNNAARGSYEQVLIRQALAGEPVGRFMNREPVTVWPGMDLRTWVEDYVYRFHRKAFPVVDDGHLRGVITTQALAGYPREEWARHTVGEAMRADYQAVSLPPGADALEALGKMQATGSSRLLVTDGDRLVGIVSLKDLLSFLHLKLQLEGPGDDVTPPDLPAAGPSEPEASARDQGIPR